MAVSDEILPDSTVDIEDKWPRLWQMTWRLIDIHSGGITRAELHRMLRSSDSGVNKAIQWLKSIRKVREEDGRLSHVK